MTNVGRRKPRQITILYLKVQTLIVILRTLPLKRYDFVIEIEAAVKL